MFFLILNLSHARELLRKKEIKSEENEYWDLKIYDHVKPGKEKDIFFATPHVYIRIKQRFPKNDENYVRVLYDL